MGIFLSFFCPLEGTRSGEAKADGGMKEVRRGKEERGREQGVERRQEVPRGTLTRPCWSLRADERSLESPCMMGSVRQLGYTWYN